MTWVAITDPGARRRHHSGQRPGVVTPRSPPKARRSEGYGWPAFEERSFEAFRSYYEGTRRGRGEDGRHHPA